MVSMKAVSSRWGTKFSVVPAKPPPWMRHAPLPYSICSAMARATDRLCSVGRFWAYTFCRYM